MPGWLKEMARGERRPCPSSPFPETTCVKEGETEAFKESEEMVNCLFSLWGRGKGKHFGFSTWGGAVLFLKGR